MSFRQKYRTQKPRLKSVYFRKRAEEGVAYGWMDGQINIFPFGPSCISFCVKYIVSEQIVLQSSVSLSSM